MTTHNDHQVASALCFQESGRILAAFSEEELIESLDELMDFSPRSKIGTQASPELISRIRNFGFNS